MSENKNLKYSQLADIQSKCENLKKDTQGHGYKFANLAQIIVMLQPLLAEHNACLVDNVISVDGVQHLETVVHFETGSISVYCKLAHETALRGTNEMQQIGSGISYCRRYNRQNLFNLTAEDDDGASYKNDTPKKITPEKKKEDDKAVILIKNLEKAIAVAKDYGIDKSEVQKEMSKMGFNHSTEMQLADQLELIERIRHMGSLRQ